MANPGKARRILTSLAVGLRATRPDGRPSYARGPNRRTSTTGSIDYCARGVDMKKWIANLALGASFGALMTLAADVALAQYEAAPAAQPLPATTQDSQRAQTPQSLPSIESMDIVKRNQAERTMDQPGKLDTTYRRL